VHFNRSFLNSSFLPANEAVNFPLFPPFPLSPLTMSDGVSGSGDYSAPYLSKITE
jgi:hypothetical protein